MTMDKQSGSLNKSSIAAIVLSVIMALASISLSVYNISSTQPITPYFMIYNDPITIGNYTSKDSYGVIRWSLNNLTQVEVNSIAYVSTNHGIVYMQNLLHNYSVVIPQGVAVKDSVNGSERKFINIVDSKGSPYTISVDSVVLGFYLAQDCEKGFINSWTSTNKTAVLANVIIVAAVFDTVYVNAGIIGSGASECIVGNATAAFSAGQVVYSSSSGFYTLADADANSTVGYGVVWVAAINCSANAKCLLVDDGYFTLSTWSWVGQGWVYVSASAGALTQTYPSASGQQDLAVALIENSTSIKLVDAPLIEQP